MNSFDPIIITALAIPCVTLIIATTAVLITRAALNGTTASHRARIITAIADLVRALRGR